MLRRLFAAAFLLLAVAPGHEARADGPARVAIAGGVLTEIAYLLGAGDRIVGVDETSRFPAEARNKPQLGYFRRLSAEGVLSLTPDMMLAAAHAGPESALQQIASAGVAVRVAPDITRVEALPDHVRFVGEALGEAAAAEALAARLAAEIAELDRSRPDAAAPRIIFVLAMRGDAPLAAGRETAPGSVIAMAGATNVADFDGYKPMTPEAVLASRPDILLMTEEHSAAMGGIAAVADSPLFGGGDAFRPKTLAAPALTVLSIGPRTPETIRRLRALF